MTVWCGRFESVTNNGAIACTALPVPHPEFWPEWSQTHGDHPCCTILEIIQDVQGRDFIGKVQDNFMQGHELAVSLLIETVNI